MSDFDKNSIHRDAREMILYIMRSGTRLRTCGVGMKLRLGVVHL